MSRARGLVHVHSEYSFDSTTPLGDIKSLARANGLSFVVQTEHSNELTAESHARYVREARSVSDDGFVMVPSVEYATEDNAIHILALGVDAFWEDLRLCPPARLRELLDRVRSAGGLSVLAHPERADAIDRLAPEILDRLDAVEVWNGKTDKLGPSPRALREVMRRRRAGGTVPALVGLDLHRTADYRPVGIEIDSRPRTENDVMDAIRAARFRVFLGPVRWNATRCGNVSVAVGKTSKALVDLARAAKRAARRISERR